MKNLLNPTPAQAKYRNRLWAKALRENKRKARRTMKDLHGGRCCLRVAEDVAIECGVEIKLRKSKLPSYKVSCFFGWGAFNVPSLNLPDGTIMSAAEINDDLNDCGLSHKQIAECVENTFVHPKNQKWDKAKNVKNPWFRPSAFA